MQCVHPSYMALMALTSVYLLLGNVQIDDPGLAYFCDVNMVKGMKDQGLDPDYLLNLYIQAYKDCLSEKPAGMNIGLHLCRGNYTVSPVTLTLGLGPSNSWVPIRAKRLDALGCFRVLFRAANTFRKEVTMTSLSSCSTRSRSTLTTYVPCRS